MSIPQEQVTCINKQPRNDTLEGITHLGGAGWKMTRQHMVEAIRAGQYVFYTVVGGKHATIAAVDGPNGPYLRTHADGSWNNNLLSLMECYN